MSTVLVVVPVMAALLLMVPADAGVVHAEGPGWKFNATETQILNPATGMPFSSLGALDRALYPGLWNAMSPAARERADTTPAISRSFGLSYSLNASQQAVSRQVEARSVTEAEYLSIVLPDLWAAIPEWQKEQYRSEQHHSLSSGLPPVNGQFTGPYFTAPGSFTPGPGSSTGGLTFGNTGGSLGESGNSWLTFGNSGTQNGEANSSWLSPGLIAPFPSASSTFPVVPVDFTRYTMPFSGTNLYQTTNPVPLVLPQSPFAAAGMPTAGNIHILSGTHWDGWSVV